MENKYEGFLEKIGRGILGIFLLLFSLALIVGSFIGAIFIPMLSLLFLATIFCSAFIFDKGLGMGFLKDDYESTGYVSDGDTQFMEVRTKKYVKRQVVTWFITSGSYATYAVYSFIYACVNFGKYLNYSPEDYDTGDFGNKAIIFLVVTVVAIVLSVVFLIIALKNKEDIKIGNYEDEE